MHAFDGRTDGQTEFPSLYRDCIPCSAVKTTSNKYICKEQTHVGDVENGRCAFSLHDTVDTDLGSVQVLRPRPVGVPERASDAAEQHLVVIVEHLLRGRRTPSRGHRASVDHQRRLQRAQNDNGGHQPAPHVRRQVLHVEC